MLVTQTRASLPEINLLFVIVYCDWAIYQSNFAEFSIMVNDRKPNKIIWLSRNKIAYFLR